jgi:fructokinase
MRTIAFGETLWDIFGSESHIGGAAFNVAAHLAKLGAESYISSAVGDDRLGDAAISTAENFGIDSSFIVSIPGAETGTVNVHLTSEGQPSYTIKENVAWDRIEVDDEMLAKIAAGPWDFLIFGTLSQRSDANRKTLERIFEALPKSTRKVYDINLRQNFHRPQWIENSLDRCSILKLNEDEANYLSKGAFGRELPRKDFAARLSERHSIETIIMTLGADGADILSPEGWTHVPGKKVKVADAVGAGDSFTASTLFALSAKWSYADAVAFGNKMGGFVASQRGAVPEYSPELRAEIERISKGPR